MAITRLAAARAALAIVLAVVVYTLIAAGAPRPSFACECIARTTEEYFNDADVVFAGTVVDVDRTAEDYEVIFDVSQHWKGLSENDRLVSVRLFSMDTGMCGYPIEEGEQYITYADKSEGQPAIGECMGTGRLGSDYNPIPDLGPGTVLRNMVIIVDPDPLPSTSTPLNALQSLRDLMLASIIAAIVSLAAGIAVIILKKR